MEDYLNISQAAKILGVSAGTLRRWDKAGKFPSQRHPINNYRIYKEDQVKFVIKEMGQAYLTDYINSVQYKIDPFFETSLGKLYNQDVIKFLKSLETSSAQLIFADPPYNIKKAEWDTFESQKNMLNGVWNGLKRHNEFLNHVGVYIFVDFLRY